jgi:hypothetical protein
MADLKPILLKIEEREGEEETKFGIFSRKRWTPKLDVHAFSSILFYILVGQLANDETSIPTSIPTFVSKIME